MASLVRYDFYHHFDERTQELMRQYAEKFYLDNDQVQRSIQKQHKWGEYKRQVIAAVKTAPGGAL